MIDSKFHVEIDGEPYRLAESAEGQHHNVRGEPLRPPNAVTVQGESSQKFQPRPEVMLWTWTDWSAGEGRRTLKFGEGDRAWQLNGVRAFEEPGHLIPGYYAETTKNSGGVVDFTLSVRLVVGMGPPVRLRWLTRLGARTRLRWRPGSRRNRARRAAPRRE